MIVAAGNRFVFCQAFDNLCLPEEPWLANRPHTVIASIPDWMWDYKDQWTGNDPHGLFLCPDILATSHYKAVYNEFKLNIGSIPHRIFGKQGIKVDDPAVLPNLSDAELFDEYKKARLFIYTSREPRHLHYSPVEAMIVGAPVLFFEKSMLHHLGGERQSGMCSDFEDMRMKAARLIEGDDDLAAAIRRDQASIVQTFASEMAKTQWSDLLVT